MKKERDPDLHFPDEQALEERVKLMMDVTVPDAPQAPAPSSSSKKISVTDDEPEPTTETPTAPSTPVTINISQNEVDKNPAQVEDTSEDVPSAPPLSSQPSSKPTAPKVSKKNIVITHFGDGSGEEKLEGKKKVDVKQGAPVVMPETVENPLIPTDKLTSTIGVKEPETPEDTPLKVEPKKSKAKATTRKGRKKVKVAVDSNELPIPEEAFKEEPIDEQVGVDVPVKEATEITEDPIGLTDDEIAEAFGATDELDDLVAQIDEETPVQTDTTPTAPALPEADSDTIPSKKKAKADPFTPLTTIRPKKPESEIAPVELKLDDPATGRAVDEIVVADADKILQLPDELPSATKASDQPVVKPKHSKSHISRRRVKRLVLTTFGTMIVVALLAALAIPTSRYKVLNSIGVRTTAVLTVTDQSTKLPLKNVTVSIGDITQVTDSGGQVNIAGLKLGKAEVKISRKAFAPTSITSELDFGNNKLPTVSLTPTGKQYKIAITDYVSGKPVKGEVAVEQDTARTDESGLATLTLEPQTKSFRVTVSASGYRIDTININPNEANPTKVTLVPVRKYAFISNKAGTQDLYKADLDGKNEHLVLKGTGREGDNTALVANEVDDVVALVSVRDSLSTLSIIDLKTDTVTTVTKAINLQLIDWDGEYLTYVQIPPDAKPADANRQQLISYSYKTNKTQQLAAANYFNSVLSAAGAIYYAPAGAYQAANNIGFFRVNADSSGKQTLLSQETWNVYRATYSHLNLSVQQDWYSYRLGDPKPTKQNAAPASLENRLYIDSPDGQQSLRVDGNSKLYLYNRSVDKETELLTDKGLSYPLRWLTGSIIMYRSGQGAQKTDYVNSLDGVSPKKVHDVMDIPGITAWQIH